MIDVGTNNKPLQSINIISINLELNKMIIEEETSNNIIRVKEC